MCLHSSRDSSAAYTYEEGEHTHLLDTADEDIQLPDVDEDTQYHGEIDEDTDMHEEQEQIEGSDSSNIALPDEFEFEDELAQSNTLDSDEPSGSIDEDTDMHVEQDQEVYNNAIPVQVPVQEFFDSGSDSSSIALPDEFEFEEESVRSSASDSNESSGSESYRDPDFNLECESGENEISETEETIQLLHELRVSEMPFSNSSDDMSDGLQCIDEKKNLFLGSGLNKLQVVCLLLRMYIRHKISFTAMDSFLKMLNFLLPQPNCLPKTWYRMKKFISAYLPKVRIYKVYKTYKCQVSSYCAFSCNRPKSTRCVQKTIVAWY